MCMANTAKNDFNDGVYRVTFHTQNYRDICLIHPIVILKFRNIFFSRQEYCQSNYNVFIFSNGLIIEAKDGSLCNI